MQRAIDLAVGGDKRMIKFLLEYHLSKPQADEEDSAGKDKVTINIRDLTLRPTVSLPSQVSGEEEAIEGDYNEVTKDG